MVRFELATTRRLARRINTQLRHEYPGVTIRTRVASDATVTMDAPIALSYAPQLARILDVVAQALGHTYTVTVRPHHSSSRRGLPPGLAGGARATLTLHPQHR